jgi:UDP-N-acetylglucosamine 1-carboxyvinyltransferase
MASFRVTGGTRLKGEIIPQGAKNEALQILCAVLLTSQKVTINKVPNIRDVNKLIELLSDMGVKVQQLGPESYSFQADDVNLDYLETNDFLTKASALRGSVMILGPLLARFGKGKLSKPGGDKIGRRRMDTHFLAFKSWEQLFITMPRMSFSTSTAKTSKAPTCCSTRLPSPVQPTSSWRQF